MATKAQLLNKIGGLSKPSKMPGYGWSIPARLCNVGSRLRNVPGSVCSKCYALKGRYVFPSVQSAMNRRYATYQADHGAWVYNMIEVINTVVKPDASGWGYFRWFDSGDIMGDLMLAHIILIAQGTPNVRHWLPTKEYAVVHKFAGQIPSNLVIRVSAPMIDGPSPNFPHTSSVSTDASKMTCPASKQGNQCGDCRACWDRNTEEVVYHAH